MARSLSVLEFSDRELLHIIDDNGDTEGYVTASEIADVIGLQHDRPTQCIGQRFSWMRKYGVLESTDVERTIDEGGKSTKRKMKAWRLTELGYRFMEGRLRAQTQRSLEGLGEEQMLELTALVTGRFGQVSEEAALLMRRQWQYGQYQRTHGHLRPLPRRRRGRHLKAA